MVHVLPSSSLELSLTPGSAFLSHKKNSLTKKHILSFSTSVSLFSKFRIGYGVQTRLQNHSVSATETDDVAVEDVLETPTEESSSDNSKRPRAVRKSEMPPVTNEELISGATFTGKVKSIQPFGAFVDFGAFTDGLVHVSQLSDSFVKDVNSVVSIGQEVSVKIVEANMETKRISLTMRTSDDITSDGSRASRSNQRSGEGKKFSKFVKGQEFQGTVKNLTRSGSFISLPEGEEGFLPTSEEADGGLGSMMGNTSLQIGEEVKVRVLRMNRGKVTLTMKNEEDGAGADLLTSHGVVHSATNPFVLAFKK